MRVTIDDSIINNTFTSSEVKLFLFCSLYVI